MIHFNLETASDDVLHQMLVTLRAQIDELDHDLFKVITEKARRHGVNQMTLDV